MNDSSLPQGTRPTLALSVTGLTKHYDSGFTLDDVTFDLPSGYIMGLVGPNGAGKSTLIKLILNMTTRDTGRIEVLGLDAMADEERAKEQLGVVLDSSYFIEYMTVDAVERTSSPMYPLWDHNLFDAYLRRFGLGRNKKIKDLSRGMQMKLMLAVALSHDAKLRKAPNAYIPVRHRFLQYGRRVVEVEHDTIRQSANRRPISIGRIVMHGPHPHADGLGRAHADEQILEYGAVGRLDTEPRRGQQVHVRPVLADIARIVDTDHLVEIIENADMPHSRLSQHRWQ